MAIDLARFKQGYPVPIDIDPRLSGSIDRLTLDALGYFVTVNESGQLRQVEEIDPESNYPPNNGDYPYLSLPGCWTKDDHGLRITNREYRPPDGSMRPNDISIVHASYPENAEYPDAGLNELQNKFHRDIGTPLAKAIAYKYLGGAVRAADIQLMMRIIGYNSKTVIADEIADEIVDEDDGAGLALRTHKDKGLATATLKESGPGFESKDPLTGEFIHPKCGSYLIAGRQAVELGFAEQACPHRVNNKLVKQGPFEDLSDTYKDALQAAGLDRLAVVVFAWLTNADARV